jgi:hypothetical protein
MAPSVVRALANFAEEGTGANLPDGRQAKWGKVLQPVVLTDLQGKGLVRQRSLSAESLFGYFCGDKSN